jgi:hypothetical protein
MSCGFFLGNAAPVIGDSRRCASRLFQPVLIGPSASRWAGSPGIRVEAKGYDELVAVRSG